MNSGKSLTGSAVTVNVCESVRSESETKAVNSTDPLKSPYA